MESGPGWLPDPEDGDRERYWNGSDWTDRVRPAGKARSLRLPEHVPELQRALAGATADIDEVEDRLSTLFDRADEPGEAADEADPAHRPGRRTIRPASMPSASSIATASSPRGRKSSWRESRFTPSSPILPGRTMTTTPSPSSMPPWPPRRPRSPKKPTKPKRRLFRRHSQERTPVPRVRASGRFWRYLER